MDSSVVELWPSDSAGIEALRRVFRVSKRTRILPDGALSSRPIASPAG